MGVELLEIGVQMKKFVICSIRVCCRSVTDHPFIVSLLCLLALLYRSFPCLVSALVSISPVIVCTALLLGALLSFGHPNAPEVEREEKTVHDILVPLKSGVSSDNTIAVEKYEGCSGERYIHEESDVQRDNSLGKGTPLIEKESQEIQLESWMSDEATRYWYGSGSEQKNVNVGYQYSSIPDMDDNNLDFDNDKFVDSFGSKVINVGSCSGSHWKQEDDEEDDEGDDDDDGSLDSGSDASMANIIPLLDELHPLLDEESLQPVNISRVDSDEFNDGVGNQGELEDSDDESENGEDEDDIEGDKEECDKSAITWTEEDEKNLMDLGSSELERNQRLEGLIARRIAQKNMGTLTKRNLVESEGFDLPFNVAPISTARKNPFDIPDDQNDLGLPPLPVSAPSSLLPRRNPFDLPFDSREEKPDLVEDCFQNKFRTSQPKELFFSRHESFKVQPSLFGPNKHDIRSRPFIVSEMESEGESYTTFQRYVIDHSDTKVSSVRETESTGFVSVLEDKDIIDKNVEGNNLNDKDIPDQNIIDHLISQEPDLMPCIDPFSSAREFPLLQQSYTYFESNHADGNLVNEEAASFYSNHGDIDLSILHTNKDTYPQCQEDEKLISVGHEYGLEEKLIFQYDEELILSGTSTTSCLSKDHNEVQKQEPPFILIDESVQKAGHTEKQESCSASDYSASVLHKVDDTTAYVAQSDIKINACDEVEIAKHTQQSETRESWSSKRVILHKDSSLIENETQFEARSTQDIDMGHQQLHEDNSERHFVHDPVDVKVNAAESSVLFLKQDLDSNLESTTKLTSKDGLPEAATDHHEAPKHDSSNSTDVKEKKEESVKSDASTSSSSDSSSSDSDRE